MRKVREKSLRKESGILALKALGWLAHDPEALAAFMQASGIEPDTLRACAGSAETAQAVLDFLLADEALLVGFCADEQIAPIEVRRAAQEPF